MSTPPLRDLFQLVGVTLDGLFRVEKVIGEGGFGIVYKGRRIDLDQPVAIKVLKVLDAFDARVQKALLSKFEDESLLLQRLSAQSPRIVRSLGFRTVTTPAGLWAPYVALEWLEGTSLDDDLVQRRAEGKTGRSVREAIELLSPLVEGLGVAHRSRVAHRDIKPGNVFLTPHGLKILDFGIAKVMHHDADANSPAGTQSPFSAFTWMYGAPEQMDSKYGPTGPWTDVYSFAMILTEVLTDRAPLLSDDALTVMVEATHPDVRPTPRTRGAVVSDAVEAVCQHALALRASDRFANIDDFWAAFTTAARNEAAPAHGGTQPMRSVTAPMRSRAPASPPASPPQSPAVHSLPPHSPSQNHPRPADNRYPSTPLASAPVASMAPFSPAPNAVRAPLISAPQPMAAPKNASTKTAWVVGAAVLGVIVLFAVVGFTLLYFVISH